MPPDNDIVDLPPGTDYRDAGAAVLRGHAALAVVNANADADAAARSAQLGAVTGAPSNVINLDPKRFEERLKSQVAQGIVGGNQSLAQYAGSDPMASIVSNDDWGHLDTLSGSLKALREATDLLSPRFEAGAEGLIKGGIEGLKEGWGEGPLMPVTAADTARAIPALDPSKSLLGGMENTALTSALNVAGVALRGLSAGFEATTGAIGGGITGLTGSESLGREAKALTEYEMIKPEHAPGGPWIMAGKEPPAGINKELDTAKAKHNEVLLKSLEDSSKLVQQSTTWERSPELFKKFVQQHLGDRSISIAGDAVSALYGDKLPEPDDGKLGWVPDIQQKLDAAKSSGADVEVPLADWLTHMDPAVAKGLHDNIRMWPEGITASESRVTRPEVPPPEPSAISQVRQASGLDPVFRPAPEAVAQAYANINEDLIGGANRLRRVEEGTASRKDYEEHIKGLQEEIDYVQGQGPHAVDSPEYGHIQQLKEELAATEAKLGGAKPQALSAARSDYPMLIGLDAIDPKAVGLPEGHWQHLQELARDQYAEDVSIAERRAERQQKQEQTAEWKSNRKDMEKEVEADLRAQPHIAADMFIGAGEHQGEKIQQRFTLREDDLNDAQKAALPAHYVSKNGLGVDDVAAHFGYGSGDAMVDALAAHNALKAGRSPNEMLRNMVKLETDRRMMAKYGDLPSNILTAAHDQALSDTTLNIVTQEYQGAAMSAKVETLTETAIKDEAKRIADAITNKDVNSRAKLAEVSKNYSDAVKGLLEQDPKATVMALQRRAIGAHVARELLNREKDIAKTEALMKKLAKWKAPGKNEVKVVDPEYLNWAHVIMDKVGQKVRRGMQTVAEDIAARSDKTLGDFVAAKQAMLRPLDIWDQLTEASWKRNWKDLNGEEARAVGGSLRSLDFHGRDELKIQRAGDLVDRAEAIKDMTDKLERLPKIEYTISGERASWIGRHTSQLRTYLASVTQMETLFNFIDKFDQWGPWNQYVMRDLINGANQAESWAKEFTKKLEDASKAGREGEGRIDLSREVDNPLFHVPLDDGSGFGPLFKMTRENLRMVLLNAGNSFGAKSNLMKMAKGYGLKPEEIMAWLHQHATKEDWDWAQGVWDGVFEGMWGHGASMYRSLTGGMTPDRVRIDPIQTRFGEYRGGYMPIDYHSKFKGGPRLDIDKLTQSNYQSALPQASWAKERTGASGPINLDMSRLPMLITRELHDIAMRPALIQASKLLMDRRVQDALASKMGMEYRDLVTPYLRGVANRQNYLTTHTWYANSILEQWRKNLVTGLVGFNPGTVMKHLPTAFILSVREVGATNMLRAYRALYDGVNPETSLSNHDFVNGQHEIQRRERNWEETLYGEMLKERPGGRGQTWSAQLGRLSAKPVAYSDMLSAKPTFLAAYTTAMEEGRSHGDAVYAGERAVRRAHGSTSLTNRPAIMRDWNPWFTSVYTFFNDIVNRQLEMLWRAGEMTRDVKTEGGWESAKTHAPAIAATLFASVIAPAIIEELVSPSGGPDAKHEGLGTKIWKGGAYTLASGLPGVRDFVHGVLYGTDPTPGGMAVTGARMAENVYRDAFKKQPVSPAHAQRKIKDSSGLAAMLTGLVTQPMGNATAFGYGVEHGTEHPKGPWGWLVGSRYGTLKGHSPTLQDWLSGRTQ